MTKRETNRLKAQEYAVYLSNNFKQVILEWATGVGKSLAAIKIIENDLNEGTSRGEWNLWYIVCAERQHITNWEDEFKKHGYQSLLDLGYIRIFCYQSLHKYKTKANLILDEAHGVTDLRLDLLQQVKGDKVISLSATLEPERYRQLQILEPDSKVYTITTDQAIAADMLPKPVVVKVECALFSRLRNQYDTYDTLIRGYEIDIGTAQAELDKLSDPFNHPKPEDILKVRQFANRIDSNKANILKTKIRRKALLANSKTVAVSAVQSSMMKAGTKFITFSGSTAQCHRLGFTNGMDIHSRNSAKVNQQRIDSFNKGDLKGLVCNKMLRQGTNLEGVEMGIICQLDAKQLSFVQMMGRIFRSHTPILFVFVTKDTVDEVYWEECIKDLDPSYIVSYKEYIKNHHASTH